ncbi:hypothetical protein CWATWH0401_2525 [Crocosphaera watsonii WH 0401]|uniref:Uncharacterized protein n=1 Tax=Crocosphaera watsonii WH 0401 TaxID=555881 RepID=T2J6P1_CROWT|nr:hypothetical protein [Crocosphaera watsonii]CCQ60880.1 hypothetical protein CWATWH0401_2525 [Crocosphaera watsonii WH 0401]
MGHRVWFGIGLIALSKGILALALGGILGVYILWDREQEAFKILLTKITQLLGLKAIFKPILIALKK